MVLARLRDLLQSWLLRMLWTTVVVVCVGTLVTAGGFGLFSDWQRADVIAAMAVVLTAGTLLLAVIAAVVAIAAYSAATQGPALRLEFNFLNNTGPGIIRWIRQPDALRLPGLPPTFFPLEQYGQLRARLTIHNDSKVSARNPALRIEFLGFARVSEMQVPGWSPVNHTRADAAYAVQWDGGADLSIHGGWSRPLPEIDLQGLQGIRDSPTYALAFFLVADGFVHEWTVPVELEIAEPK